MRKLYLIPLIVLAACSINSNPGTGEKVGQIVKFSKVGLSCKTWEGEIVRGGFSNTSGVNGTSFDFTIENDSLAKLADSLMDARKEVKIEYRTEFVSSICRNDTDNHFVTGIKVIG